MSYFYLALEILIFAAVFSLAFSTLSFAPWVPTKSKDLDRAFKLAKLTRGEKFYDLGSGNGRVVFYASQNYGAKAVGIELAFPLVLFSLIKKMFLRDRNSSFKWASLFKVNLNDADVVYIFGVPGKLKEKMVTKLKKELKPGARVLSYVFRIEGLEPGIVGRPSAGDLSIYLYRI